MVNLKLYGSWIQDGRCITLKFPLIATLYLTKMENKTKNIEQSFFAIGLSKSTIFVHNTVTFFQKHGNITKINVSLKLKCVYLHNKFQVFSIKLMSFGQRDNPSPQNEPLKTITKIGIKCIPFEIINFRSLLFSEIFLVIS